MANDQDIAFNLDVNTTGGAKSMADLKKEFKELQVELSKTKEGTKEYQLALQKLGAVKDDIGDLRDTINALNPEGKVAAFAKVGSTIASGFAAAQGAAALFGAESEDLQKSIMKVQAAMALAEGIKGLVAAGDAFRVLNAVMAANPITAIVLGFTALVATVGVLYKNYLDANSASANLQKTHEKLIESSKELNKEYDIQIKNLSGLKANEGEINEIKEKQIKINIELAKSALAVALAKQSEAEASTTLEESLLRATGQEEAANILRFSRIKEQRDATNQSITSLKESIADLSKFHNEQEQEKLDKEKEAHDKSLDAYKKHLKDIEDAQKKHNDEFARQLDLTVQSQLDNEAAEKKRKEDAEKEEIDRMGASNEEAMQQTESVTKKQVLIHKNSKEEQQAINDEYEASSKEATQKGLQAAQALTDLYFAHQLKQSKGNAAAELELRKKQFKVNKAFGIVNAVVDGVGAVQKALNNPYPLNIVLAVLSGVLAAANVAKIASSKFEGTETSAGADVGAGMTASAPVVPQPNNTTTKIDDNGIVEKTKPEPQRVYLVETDIKKSTSRVANIEETAKIG